VPIVGRLLFWLLLFVGLAHVGAGTVGRLLGLMPTRLAVAQLSQEGAVGETAGAGIGGTPPADEDGSARPPAEAPTSASCSAGALGCGSPRGEPGDAGVDAGAARARLPDGRVVLNLASETELVELPGIGPKRAQAIVALRTKLGRFRRLEDLLRVRGIGPKAIARLRPLVVLDSPEAE
jgi:competence protein ComEA